MLLFTSSVTHSSMTVDSHVFCTTSCTGWMFLSGCSTSCVQRSIDVCSTEHHSTWRTAASTPPTLLVGICRVAGNTVPQYMMDCCIHTSDIARHQHLRSAGCHQLFILRHRHSVFGRWASSIAGPAELVTRLPARSITFLWQFSPGAENFSFLIYFFCFHGWQFLTTGKVKCKNNNITMCQMPLDAFLLSTCAPTFSWEPVLAGCHVILRVLDANCHVAGSVFFCIPPVTRRHQCHKSWSFALSGKCPCGRQ